MKPMVTTQLMRLLNRSAVLDLIRERKKVTRTDIAQTLGLSSATVMRIVDELVEEDLVVWSGNSEASGGRPRMLLEFNTTAYAVIGLDLGGTKLYGTIADLGGTIQHEIYTPWQDNASDREDNIEQVCALIETLLAAPCPDGQKVRGIGIGAPGVTESEAGIVRWAPSLNWRDLSLRDMLQERFDLPVAIENDVNLAALGEYGFGVAKGAGSLVCMAIGTGIGAGIVIDRKIYKGHNYSAGEVGYLPPDLSHLGKKYPGFGALEGLASGLGVENRARQYLADHNMAIPDQLTGELVFATARAHEPWAQHIISETVDYLSFAISVIAAILDPEVIVLGGGVGRSADLLIDPILERIDGLIPSIPKLMQSNLGSQAAVMGAILLVMDTTTEYVALTTPLT
ncbi:ROK family protein [Chloroflexota bacterium]